MKAQDRRKAYALLKEIVTQYRAILGGNLVGMYLHGSLAFGCFRWEASDIDFLVVTQAPPSPDEKLALLRVLSGLERSAPPKGFEMSVVLERECLHFRYPTPFELHYSNAHATRFQSDPAAYCAAMHGTDPDLAAHFTVIRSVGRALWGKPISAVFGDVPREAYLRSILADVSGAENDVASVYIVLNLCRVLAYAQDGMVLSKAQGGRWVLAHLPQADARSVSAALASYEGGAPFALDAAVFQAFAPSMLNRIHSLL